MVFRPFNLRVHLDWINGMWISSQNKEAEVLAQDHANFQTPIPVSSSICSTYMDISRTPNEMMGSPSTPNKTSSCCDSFCDREWEETKVSMSPLYHLHISSASPLNLYWTVLNKLISQCNATNQEMIAIAHNDRTLLAPIRTGGSSCCHDMSTSIKPSNEKLQKKQHPDLPSTQMKEPLKCTDIKLHGIGGTDNQIVVCKGKGGSLIGSGPEHEVSCEELTVDQMETMQLLSMPVEVCLPLSPSLEKSSSPAEKENREVSPDNQLIPSEAIAQIDASIESIVLLESSNAIENVFVAEYTTLNPLIQYEDASEDERGLHSANVAESTSPAQYNVHDESLPFIKSSPLWETFDSTEVFQLIPQHPHFRPLEKYDEEVREGYAVGNMVNFANLAKRILKTKLEEPQSLLEKS
ncbi:hypothetical protein FRX31_015748 [Thalictrum thalictroides]|uniref:Uncharacterized protein n=1 Tax=Thalictrum thalictroides TaxID=46969 RepID=A0A7J6WE63_THATH|nr:hypothetical protein FRX31_015748 [Thalictrum thalictroides]